MNLSAKKSSIHHHLTRPVFKKTVPARSPVSATDAPATRVASGFGPLQMGTDALPIAAAYKPIFRF